MPSGATARRALIQIPKDSKNAISFDYRGEIPSTTGFGILSLQHQPEATSGLPFVDFQSSDQIGARLSKIEVDVKLLNDEAFVGSSNPQLNLFLRWSNAAGDAFIYPLATFGNATGGSAPTVESCWKKK